MAARARICQFTSELFYEGRLHSRDGLEKQVLSGAPPYEGSGLWFEPVEHDGNRDVVVRRSERPSRPSSTAF